MQRPHDALHLSPAEGDALIERLEHNVLRAEDLYVLVKVVLWLFWLIFVVQEAKLSLKRLRTLLCGNGAPTAQAWGPEAASAASELGSAGGGVGKGRASEAEQSGAAAPGASDPAPLAKPTGGHRRGTGRLGADAYGGLSAPRAAMRSWQWGSAARCAVRAPSMRCPPGWRCASTAMPCSVPCATS